MSKKKELIESMLVPEGLRYQCLPLGPSQIPKLHHGLSRVLFSPGPQFLRDPRTARFNFDKRLLLLPKPDAFDMNSLPAFVKGSQDTMLAGLCREHGRKYFTSTSSLTTTLAKLHLLISGQKTVSLDDFTKPFGDMTANMAVRLRTKPFGLILRHRDDTYGIEIYDPSPDPDSAVLLDLGHIIEQFITTDTESFDGMLRGSQQPQTATANCFMYSLTDKFILRAQLDCAHPALPKQRFDIKSRATLPIRMYLKGYESNLGYKLTKRNGLYESFEREYYDLLRTGLISYSLQARIGNMDGIFVCYHNTQEVFGFEYLPLEKIDRDVFGSTEFANQSFALTLQLAEAIMDTVTARYPNRDVKVLFNCPRDGRLKFYALPETNTKTLKDEDITCFTLATKSFINGFAIDAAPFVNDGEDETWGVEYKLMQSPGGSNRVAKLEQQLASAVPSSDYVAQQIKRHVGYE